MEVEEFLKNVCLTACLQQMEEHERKKMIDEEASMREKEQVEGIIKEIENRNGGKGSHPTEQVPEQLLEGPLVLDQQCIDDLCSIKRDNTRIPNNQVILIALKLGLNQLNVAMCIAKNKIW